VYADETYIHSSHRTSNAWDDGSGAGSKAPISKGRRLIIVHAGNKTAQRMGMLGPLLNRKSDLSVRNGVLLYKQLIRPMMNYACPAWRFAARTHVRRLQVLQSRCLRLATGAPWYVSSRQIHEDLGVPLFADHIRALTVSFDSKLADVGNPLVRQLGRYLR
jgi:hypothetical protein